MLETTRSSAVGYGAVGFRVADGKSGRDIQLLSLVADAERIRKALLLMARQYDEALTRIEMVEYASSRFTQDAVSKVQAIRILSGEQQEWVRLA